MRSVSILRLALLLVFFSAVATTGVALAADGPMELAGIRLGQTVDENKDKLLTDNTDRLIYRPYLGIMPVAPVAGFRSGYVDYGLCAAAGRIVRVKMNYADDSLDFFKLVLEALKKRYGEPKEWRGNAFGTLRTWKWSLKAANGQAVSLILMHYAGDDGAFTDGNSIRVAATDLVREEEACYAAKDGQSKGRDDKKLAADLKSLGLEWFLPK
ncbi:MAG: hypothetical protein AB9872_04950 [Solidesulfovibrio sp.]